MMNGFRGRGKIRKENDFQRTSLKVVGVVDSLDGITRRSVTSADATGVFFRLRAEHHVATDGQTLAIDADVGALLVVAASAVNHLAPVSVIKAFPFRHTVELAFVRRPRVRNPPVAFVVVVVVKFNSS